MDHFPPSLCKRESIDVLLFDSHPGDGMQVDEFLVAVSDKKPVFVTSSFDNPNQVSLYSTYGG